MGTSHAEALLRRALLKRAGKSAPRGLGLRDARRGDGYEFAELRAYVAGDDPRHIDWAASARADALQTRVLFEEQGLTLATCIDASASMHIGRERSLYDAACEAARLWFSAAHEQDRCARMGEGYVLRLPHLRGKQAGAFCIAHREDPTRLREALELAQAALPRAASLLIVSDFYDIAELEASLRSCALRFDATVLLARDPWHAGLPLGGFVRVRDAESEREARVYIGEAERERYLRAVRAREKEILERFAGYGLRAGLLDAEHVERDLLRMFGLA